MSAGQGCGCWDPVLEHHVCDGDTWTRGVCELDTIPASRPDPHTLYTGTQPEEVPMSLPASCIWCRHEPAFWMMTGTQSM